jgi:hypothetical protein
MGIEETMMNIFQGKRVRLRASQAEDGPIFQRWNNERGV